jgi:hypothetical protein
VPLPQRTRPLIGACGLALVLLAPAGAHAARTDMVLLRNGDRLTCEIKRLDRGRLTVETDDAGTIDIEWDNIARVTAQGTFEVEIADGRRLVGSLSSGADGSLTVSGLLDNGTFTTVDVVGVAPIGRSFFHRIDGALDFGFSFVKSSGITQFSVNTTARYRKPAFELGVAVSSSFTYQSDGDDTDRLSGRMGYTRLLQRRWTIGGLGFVDRNPDLGFEIRTSLGGLIGRRIVQSNRARFTVAGGIAVGREQSLTGAATTTVDAVGLVDGSFFTYDTPKTDLSYTVLVFTNVRQAERVRLEPSLTLRRELFHDFTISLSAYDSYDSQPPSEGVSTNDVGVTLSIGWTF